MVANQQLTKSRRVFTNLTPIIDDALSKYCDSVGKTPAEHVRNLITDDLEHRGVIGIMGINKPQASKSELMRSKNSKRAIVASNRRDTVQVQRPQRPMETILIPAPVHLPERLGSFVKQGKEWFPK
jgi:hypothetical protein